MKQELGQAAKARKTVHRMFKKLGLDGEYIYNPTAMLVARNAFKAGAKWQKEQDDTMFDASLKRFADTNYELGYKAGAEWQKKQKPLKYFPKEKVYDIMSKLTDLSYSKLIPIRSEEYIKINEITSDIRDLLDYPIEQKNKEI